MSEARGVFQIVPGGKAALLSGDVAEDELRIMEQLFRDYGNYRLTTEGAVLRPGLGIGEGIPVEQQAGMAAEADASFTRHRILNNPGTELIFPPRFDISILADKLKEEHGNIYGRPTLSDDQRPTFRGLYTVIDRNGITKKAEGDARDELYVHVQKLQSERFVPAARRLFGTPIVVPKMLFANMLLPGQEISMHQDVPEFRGIHPKTCPNWMQCVMHASGLFERWRILQAACLTYFQDMDCGSLAVYTPDGGTVIPARRGLGVLVEAETLPHHSDVFPPIPCRRPPAPTWPKGVRLRFLPDANQWVVLSEDGSELERYASNEVRISTQMKLHCFRNEEEERKYHDRSDDITVDRAIEMLTDDLRSRGCFSGAPPPRSELAVMLIREYMHWPTPDAVKRCWESRPDSVFAKAFCAPQGSTSTSQVPQRARL
jgi:hypothetical protein